MNPPRVGLDTGSLIAFAIAGLAALGSLAGGALPEPSAALERWTVWLYYVVMMVLALRVFWYAGPAIKNYLDRH